MAMQKIRPDNDDGRRLNGTPHNRTVNQEVQQPISLDPKAPVEYPRLYRAITPLVQDDKDLVNFAYYLYCTKLTAPHQHNDDEWEGIRMRANFCDCARSKSGNKVMQFSRLEQLYAADIFQNDYYQCLWKKKASMAEDLKDPCSRCKAAGSREFAICPYWLCHIVAKTAEAYRTTPDALFDELLGDAKIPFPGTDPKTLTAAIPAEYFAGMDAKSAHGAYMLLVSRLVNPKERDGSELSYTHVPLCKGEERSSKVDTMIEFWKTGSGVYDRIDCNDRDTFLKHKVKGCRRCGYEQCPHKLAAYFLHLAEQFHVPATDLAYYAATASTYAAISLPRNFQFNRYLSAAQKLPMNPRSKEEFVKIIHYVVGRSQNSRIPFLPFNTAIVSPDRENASELSDVFGNAFWFFDYYGVGRDDTDREDLFMSSVSVSELIEKYEKATAGNTFTVYDVNLLCDNREFQACCHRLLKIMQDRKTEITTLLIGDKDEISRFFQCYPEFKSKVFSKTLELFDMDNGSVYDELVDKLTETFTLPDEVGARLEQYVQLAYPASPLRSKEFVSDLHEKILFNHYNHDVQADSVMTVNDIPYITPPRSEQEIFEEINRLTGLHNVKDELRVVNDLVKFNIKMGSANKNAVNLHMVFTGNPGTGKTTVARLTAEILHSIGFIQENKLVVCSAKDLIGEYVGQTAPQTAKKCEEAYNGVLFIDEAYQLNPYTSNRADVFKEECIAELIQQMENNRDRLVVIFAGYTQEMEDFLNRANTGLRSRIGKIIDFPDYTVDELLDIFTKIVTKNGMELGEGAAAKAADIFDRAIVDTARFGNARYARNLYERSLMQHAAVTANLEVDDPALRILQSDEIVPPSV